MFLDLCPERSSHPNLAQRFARRTEVKLRRNFAIWGHCLPLVEWSMHWLSLLITLFDFSRCVQMMTYIVPFIDYESSRAKRDGLCGWELVGRSGVDPCRHVSALRGGRSARKYWGAATASRFVFRKEFVQCHAWALVFVAKHAFGKSNFSTSVCSV